VFKSKKRKARSQSKQHLPVRGWAKPGMRLTFRAEVMPGREPAERMFTVTRVLANGRVELRGLFGQHTEKEFESVR
jgi:hypothetical protein